MQGLEEFTKEFTNANIINRVYSTMLMYCIRMPSKLFRLPCLYFT